MFLILAAPGPAAVRALWLQAGGRGLVTVMCGPQWLQHLGSVVVLHGLSCPKACGIFPDQGSDPCPLYWQVDS